MAQTVKSKQGWFVYGCDYLSLIAPSLCTKPSLGVDPNLHTCAMMDARNDLWLWTREKKDHDGKSSRGSNDGL